MRPLVIVNPRSAGGATGRTFRAMQITIERALGPVEVVMTERPRHATDLAREGALAGHPLVVAVGGDGTFHEVVNGLMQARAAGYGTKADEVRIGLIGQGTGGDFRKTLGLEHRLDRYLAALASGRERPIDVGRFSGGGVTNHYFANILSVGMGGLVDRYVAHASRLLGGKVAYFNASLRALTSVRLGHVRCTVTHDGETQTHRFRSFVVGICNGRYFGAGMQLAPMAEVDDGVFELVAIGATSKLGIMTLSRSIYAGEHLRQPGALHLRGQKFTLDIENEDARSTFLVDADGEGLGPPPLEIEVVPKALVLRG